MAMILSRRKRAGGYPQKLSIKTFYY